jgi:hypothetical protein
MKYFSRAGMLAAAATLMASSAFAQTNWDMPTPYGDGIFHTQNIRQFADDIKEATGGSLTITWVRRTRLGGEWVDAFETVPVAEDAEAYELEILDGPGGSVVRTATGIISASFVYTTALQSADFGTPQTELTFRVYQLSAQVGRGFPSEDTTADVT